MKIKTRIAYGYNPTTGQTLRLGDTVKGALNARQMVRDYEASLILAHPELKITIKIEEV